MWIARFMMNIGWHERDERSQKVIKKAEGATSVTPSI